MTEDNTRLTAIRNLLNDETARKNREKWEAILADESLTPETQTDVFKKQFYDLLITEMEEGYQRNDKIRREKRRKTGKTGGYIPPQMRVNSTIGRFLFAYFKWHNLPVAAQVSGIEVKGLTDIAEAFGFRIDPTENQRQFLEAEERQSIINKEKDRDYNKRIWGMIITGFSISIILVLGFFLRRFY